MSTTAPLVDCLRSICGALPSAYPSDVCQAAISQELSVAGDFYAWELEVEMTSGLSIIVRWTSCIAE